MINKDLEILINREIDGTATPEDSARLKRALAQDEEARLYQQDLQRLSRVMGEMGPVEPPAELKPSILREIEAAVPVPVPHRTDSGGGWITSLAALASPFRHFRPAYGASFAGGLAAGLAIFALFSTPGILEDGTMSGMMAPQQTFDRYAPGETVPFRIDGATGVLETRYSEGLVLAKITIDAPGDVEILTRFDNTVLHPVGYRSLHSGAGGVVMGTQEMRLSHRGRNEYWLIFQETGADPSTIQVTLSSGDQVYTNSLQTRGRDS